MGTIPVLNKKVYESKFGPLAPLPEKVLQFGTGVLLRGLPDYFIDKANKQGVFNGSIVVVKSTSTGNVNEFDDQDSIFTHTIKGIADGKMVNELIVNTSISRVIAANSHWDEITALAKSTDLQIIISNTTEAGLVLELDDQITAQPPHSFPGKLLSVLHTRWQHFNGAAEAGLVILPTELLPDNGMILQKIIFDLAAANHLPAAFIEWLSSANDFCNTLVDRIVPGKLATEDQKAVEEKLGYTDHLLISSEPFALWAIESKKPSTKELLSFASVDASVVVAPSISKFRELKLRLLNGTHTFCCGVAILAGFETVKEAMVDSHFRAFIARLLKEEIAPCVVNEEISLEEAIIFGNGVADRFANPTIEHKWTSIASGFVEKMKLRNTPLIERYANKYTTAGACMSLGFAAFCCYQEKQTGVPLDITEYSTDAHFIAAVKTNMQNIQSNGMQSILSEFVK
jgi:tagaturonate reductase